MPKNLPIPVSPTLSAVVQALASAGYRALVVGGSVRDALLGIPSKDIDVEVYGVSYETLEECLAPFGRIDAVGRAFGVLKLTDASGETLDFAIPRTENTTGIGHRDFRVAFDSTITPEQAASRRDFTINAIAWDPITHEILDYFGGVADVESRTLRHVGPQFIEDSLRVLRGMQFVARFELEVAPETLAMIRNDLSEPEHFTSLPVERIGEEFRKLAIQGIRPGLAFTYLRDTGWIRFFPALEAMIGVPQEPEWHPEGDVAIHTAHVLDAAADIATRDKLDEEDRAVLLFAALTHDIAKPATTKQREKDGILRWTSYGHEEAGGPMAAEFLQSIGIAPKIIRRVEPLVTNHLAHMRFAPELAPAFVRKLADRLAPSSIEEFTRLVEADASGRPPLPKRLPDEARDILEHAREDGCATGPPEPLIQGRDVLPYFGGNSGPHIGEITRAAYRAQLAGKLSTVEQALAWLDEHVRPKVLWINGEDVLTHFDGHAGPHVGRALEAAWREQKAGRFANREEALAWLATWVASETS